MRRLHLLVQVPAFSLGIFLVELFRRHGYESLGDPLRFTLVASAIIATVPAVWILYAVVLARFARIDLRRALALDLASYLPFALLGAYFLPIAQGRLNVGTLLFFGALAACLALKGGVALYYRRERLEAIAACPGLILGLIVGAGLLTRFSLIAANRFFGDEALFCHWGLLIASGQDMFLKSEIVDKPPVFFYTLALFFKVFGPTETAARLPNIIASLTGIVIVYELARRLYDRRVATLSALFLALSPFDIQLAPTAFTDPLMVALALGSCLAALVGRFWAAGLAIGLAAMTKPTAILFAPLLLLTIAVHLAQEGWKGRLGRAVVDLGMGLAPAIVATALWDSIIRVENAAFADTAVAHYGGIAPVALGELAARLAAWLGYLQYATGSRALNALLLVGVPCLLAAGLWRRRARPGWLYDAALAGFAAAFLAVHTLLSFGLWDRYLLGLVPIVAMLLARVVLLPFDLVPPGPRLAAGRWAYGLLLGVFLAASLAGPVHTALRYGYPLGGDRGTYQGIEDVAAYFKGNMPRGAVVYHHWLGWLYRYYMFDFPYNFYYYPSFAYLVEFSGRFPPGQAQYVVLPSDQPADELNVGLKQAGRQLRELYRTYRPDGTVSFTIYRIEPLGGG